MNPRRILPTALLAIVPLLGLAGCGTDQQGAGQPTSGVTPTPAAEGQVIVEKPWVRSTEGATDTAMSAAFADLSNPGDADVNLIGAESEVAGMVQLHVMETVDGKMVMKQTDKVTIPAGRHEHLAPGGPHIMLMDLRAQLVVGEEVPITLTFDNGQKTRITAQVRKFTEEGDQYHTHPAPPPAT